VQSLVPAMLQTLGAALTEDEDMAQARHHTRSPHACAHTSAHATRAHARLQEALGLFVGLAENDPRFIRKYINEVALAMLTIAEARAYAHTHAHVHTCEHERTHASADASARPLLAAVVHARGWHAPAGD
jgi:hypothetical protein